MPPIAFSRSTTKSRRRWNVRRHSASWSCGPVNASMAAA